MIGNNVHKITIYIISEYERFEIRSNRKRGIDEKNGFDVIK